MTFIDYEVKRPLIERLDKCLLDHAVAAGTKEGGPDIVDVYKLGGLSEVHYYLKVEHDFSAAEVEALMQFADPLEVAGICWEECESKEAFSICDMLDKINAFEVCPLVDPAGYTQKQNQMIADVKATLDQNMREYQESLLRMDKTELIEKSMEITVMREAYAFMLNDFTFQRGDAEVLLHMDNPLRFVAEQWPPKISGMFDMNDLVGEMIDAAGKTDAPQRGDKITGEKEAASAEIEKPSIRGQLRETARDTSQRQHPEVKPRGGDAR